MPPERFDDPGVNAPPTAGETAAARAVAVNDDGVAVEAPPGSAPGDAPAAAPKPGTAPDPDPGTDPGTDPEPAGGDGGEADDGRFRVVLENFEGPFDLLLQLISRHRLDVTEVALSRVTDDFLAHLRAMGPEGDLDQTTEFLVVAATLLDLKAARLLPTAEVEDEADLALLEARDLLFARLLQYRAFKRIAEIFADRLGEEALRHPRTVGLEPHHAELLPDVVIRIGPEGFARLAVKAMRPKPKPEVYVEHIHAPLVSVREQAEVVIGRLREVGSATFAELTGDAPDTLTVVARFLALLELYRERAVALEQEVALGPLLVRWSGAAPGRALVSDEFDRVAGAEEATDEAADEAAEGGNGRARGAGSPGEEPPPPPAPEHGPQEGQREGEAR
ncbi:segregation/condensation protein A [Streptomyces triticirhizae]|uniref:Segregation and condensation protein A n=1 Tax=Streptomyces triticirhizae TaxID=2483353 RepID=A0A3M2KS61_9ACTN|nr:segregation/condensation protein A [Streptomyces triticirhizae]